MPAGVNLHRSGSPASIICTVGTVRSSTPAGRSALHAFARASSGRATYLSATDPEALSATVQVARTEGILVALETAHAFARLGAIAAREHERLGRPARLALCLSGRGDKDLATLQKHVKAPA